MNRRASLFPFQAVIFEYSGGIYDSRPYMDWTGSHHQNEPWAVVRFGRGAVARVPLIASQDANGMIPLAHRAGLLRISRAASPVGPSGRRSRVHQQRPGYDYSISWSLCLRGIKVLGWRARDDAVVRNPKRPA